MNELISFLENQDVEYQREKNLSKCTSVGIGGFAKIFISPNSKEKFTKTLDYLYKNKILCRVVGNMTNILPKDEVIETVIVSTLKMNGVSVLGEYVYADCGALFSRLISFASRYSLGGCEALFGIPGTVGAMLSNNAGAYGASISDFLSSVEVYSPSDSCVLSLNKEDVSFFYRDSELKRQGFIVLSATFALEYADRRSIEQRIKDVRKKRVEAQPLSAKSLGSVFKKTEKGPASYLIDRSGLKGFRIGDVYVSEKHAGFFINGGEGTAADFLMLTEFVKAKVKEKHGVICEEEFELLI